MHETTVRLVLVNILLLIPIISVLSIQVVRPGEITPTDEIFSVSIDNYPIIDPEEWNLTISGDVAQNVTISYEELRSMPNVTEEVQLQCVEGYVAYADWTGVTLAYLMEMVSPGENVVDVVFIAADGYTSSVNLDWINASEVILAYGVNGGDLTPKIGYPLRVVMPNQYGYKWVMWVSQIQFVDYDYIGYWESRGWSDNAQYEQVERTLYPFNWRVHALLLAAAFYIGGNSLLAGGDQFLSRTEIMELPRWMGRKFHLITGIGYMAITIVTTGAWTARSIYLKGNLNWEFHGIMAVTSMGAAILVGFLSLWQNSVQRRYLQAKREIQNPDITPKLQQQRKVLQYFHTGLGLISFGAMLLAIISGIAYF
jgi:DMSO/TMAO reductase YedYZ molybdopterin-dependent catalytic subunit